MVKLVWTESALTDLDEIAEYIAIDNPSAASGYVKKVFKCIEHLKDYPNSGKRPTELTESPYREIVIPPCRIFYRAEDNCVYIVHIMRSERLLHAFMLDRNDRSE